MDLSQVQFEGIKKMIEGWISNDTHELEVTFSKMDVDTFLKIIRRLKEKGFDEVEQPNKEKLNIICKSGLRFTLESYAHVTEYCKDDLLNNKGWLAIKKNKPLGDKFPDTIDINEYGIRIKTREEHDYGRSTVNERIKVDDENRNRLVDETIANWAKEEKIFRLIKRWSFKNDKTGVQFDLSMVRQSGLQKTFNQTKFARREPTYEIEVELIRGVPFNEIDHRKTPRTNSTSREEKLKYQTTVYLNRLISGIGEVLRCIQQNILLITNTKTQLVKSQYARLANIPKFPLDFRGVKPRTILMEHMRVKRTPKQPNIRDGYNVTDKADGLRVHAFTNNDGELYMIDMSLNVYATGLKQQACNNSLLDGEWVTRLSDKSSTQQLLLFDVYHMNGKKIWDLPFYKKSAEGHIDKNTRHTALGTFIENWSEPEILIEGYKNHRSRLLQVSAKEFFFGSKEAPDAPLAPDSADSIFNQITTVFNKSFPYHTDGLILTPNEKGLPERSGIAFMDQLKWKPAEENTIDFLVMIEKTKEGTDKIYHNNNAVRGNKRLILYVSSTADQLLNNPREAILFKKPIAKEGWGQRQSRVAEFSPSSDNGDKFSSTSYCECRFDAINELDYVTSELDELIQDETIVEMKYKHDREPGFRWVPMRVRHDKTEKFRRAKREATKGINLKGTMNSDFVANETWNSIYKPLTKKMIMEGTEDVEEEDEIPEAPEEGYNSRKRITGDSKTAMEPMRKFHNDWIKNEVLLKPVLTGEPKQKILVDMACGPAKDIHKWTELMPKFVLGIDYFDDEINNKNTGAYSRMFKNIKEYGTENVPDMVFVAGDVTKPIVTGDAANTPEESKMLQTLFGKDTNDSVTSYPYVDEFKSILKDKADVVSCMFAIHYFFKDEETFTGFLQNVKDCLKIGGYFIGCCFDGNQVFNLLKQTDTGDTYIGQYLKKTIWTIRKDYEQVDEERIGFGKQITVQVASIGQPHPEFLVPWNILQEKMASIGCELVQNPLEELNLLNSTNLFSESYKMAVTVGKKKYGLEKVPAVQEYSFLNRWFIFKRTSEAAPVVISEESKEGATEGGGKEVPQEKIYADAEVFKISISSPLHTIPGFKRKDARRWLSLMIPIDIPDEKDDAIIYPTIEHFLAGMKYKLFSDTPETAAIFQTTGFYSKSAEKIAEANKEKGSKFYKLLEKQFDLIKKHSDKKTIGLRWQDEKIRLLQYALDIRMKKDTAFRDILLDAKHEKKLLLSADAVESDLNGTLEHGKLVGENKLGTLLMELVHYKV